jgi:hypothetical protein
VGIEPATSCVVGEYSHHSATSAAAIEQNKKINVINVVNVQKDVRLVRRVTMCLSAKIVDTLVFGRPSLYDIDSVHQIETSLSHALLVY